MFEQYVSEETILKEIMYYIDTDFYNYAVMIDGAWGSGKTYFVKHVLLKKIESNEKRVLYVSLYGISNIQELGKKLYLDFLFKDKSKLVTEHSELVENVIGTMIDIGAPFMGKLGDIDIKEKKIKNIVQNTVKHICPMKNCVLIFDDLERCDCSIQDILGYINGFVEQAEMKVIIIANQEELRKKVDAQTLAMQIRAVIGRDETLDFAEPRNRQLTEYLKSMKKGLPEDEKIKKLSLNEAKDRVTRLFCMESEYERIREKIIGTVFHYNPDIKKVMSNLIQKNFTYNTNSRRQLEKNINYLAESMEEEKHINFRTFQFFLQKMDGLFQELNVEKYENVDFIYKIIILSCWESCILFKAGKLKTDLKDEYYKDGGKIRIRFIEDYIKYSWLDVEKGKRVLKKFDVEESRVYLLLNDPINLLQKDWYKADNDEFILDNMGAVRCMRSYQDASSIDLGLIDNAYGNLDFIISNHSIREYAYNDIFDKMRKFVYQFREEAYHFNLLNDGKGNFAVCASKVVDLNKLFFATKDVEAHGYVNTLVYQTAFDEIESELEKFRCQIYKAKYVPVKASPISGMMRYFGEDSETKGTDE